MSCARGCCATQREHYQSLAVASSDHDEWTKTTTHDLGTHTVDEIDHFDGRRDITVHAPQVVARAHLTEV